MHKLGLGLFGLAVFLVINGCSTPMDQYETSKMEVPRFTDDGTVVFYTLSKRISGRGRGFETLQGLADAKGNILFEPEYDAVTPVNDRIVYTRKGKSRVYDLHEGAFRKEQWSELHWGKETLIGVNRDWQSKLFNLTLIDKQTGKPCGRLPDLDGYTTEVGDVIIAHKTIADGMKVSQVIDRKGKQVTPVVGRIYCRNLSLADIRDVVYQAEELPETEVHSHDRHVYVPLGENGLPLPLPEGAIGLVVLGKPYTAAESFELESMLKGWAIVYETPRGFEFAPGIGYNAENVLEEADLLSRYDAIATYNFTEYIDAQYPREFPRKSQLKLAVKEIGGDWSPFNLGDEITPYFLPGEETRVCSTLEIMKSEEIAVYERRKAAHLAREKVERDKFIAQLKECIKNGDEVASWRLANEDYGDKEAFMLYVKAFGIGPNDISLMKRYNFLTESNYYAYDIKAAEAAEYEQRQIKLAEINKRKQDELAYERELYASQSGAGGNGYSSSTADSIMETERKRNQAAKERALKGANIIYYDQ